MRRLHTILLTPLLAACSASGAADPQAPAPSQLQVTDATVGTGDVARRPRCIYAHYTVWLEDGTRVESSLDAGAPIAFSLGARSVIRGWNEGFEGMRVGGVRRLVVPQQLAYGARGKPPAIPPRATLTFDVQLLAVADPLPQRTSISGELEPRECPSWARVSGR